MTVLRERFSKCFLGAPTPLNSVSRMPLVGNLLHRLSHWIVPLNQKLWIQVQAGPAKGIWMEVNPRTSGPILRGEAEPVVMQALEARPRPGMVFYDLGANFGYFSLFGARQVGDSGRVFSFEPDGELADRLRRNAARSDFANVTIVPTAVSSHSGTVKFIEASGDSPDRATGHIAAAEEMANGRECPSVSLDAFLQSAPPPNVIKCDVEGAEGDVFRGAAELLASHKPFIILEVHSGQNWKVLPDIFLPLGYRIERLDENHCGVHPPGD